MRRTLVGGILVLGMLVTLAVAGCAGYGGGNGGGGTAAGNTFTMGGSGFADGTSLTIAAGQAVTFDDPASSGGTHHLVTGTSGQFAAETGAPSEFATSAGIDFHPGDSKAIAFTTPGTYHITCTIHPSMQATITVT